MRNLAENISVFVIRPDGILQVRNRGPHPLPVTPEGDPTIAFGILCIASVA